VSNAYSVDPGRGDGWALRMRVLITGSSGFIGRYLAAHAVSLGHEVVGTYLADRELEARDLPRNSVRWERLDIQRHDDVERIVQDVHPEAVFHLAAQAYAKRAWADPADTFRTNVLGTIYLYEALKAHAPKASTLLASSGASYGVPRELPIREDVPLNATNPYGVSKATQDMLSFQYAINFDLRILRARLFGTTGPGKTGDALNDFARQVALIERGGMPGTIRVGNLETQRDISDIRDVVRAIWTIFEFGKSETPVNVGAGRSYSIRWIAEQLIRSARVPITLETDAALLRPTDEPDNRADTSRLESLGYERQFPLERTIVDALEYWRAAA
jgi:GDP-4-dehydro-6-deoxy-D-mannose reductase